MSGILNIALRLIIWFLLTADLSWPNILIGLAIAFILPRNHTRPGRVKDWLKTLFNVFRAIPQAFVEAIQITISPRLHEYTTLEKARSKRTPGLIFLDIFIITFTPKTIVLSYRKEGWFEIHHIGNRKTS